jgi:predicted Zn-dependent protease
VGGRLGGDSAYRALARAELERQAAASPMSATANNFLANLDLIERRDADAARHLKAALAVDPGLPAGHERLAQIALRAGRAEDARREYSLELRRHPENRGARDALRRIEGRAP